MKNKSFKQLLKSLFQIREGEIKTHGPYKSLDDMLTRLDTKETESKHKNLLWYFIYYRIYLPLYRLWSNKVSNWHWDIKYFFQRGIRGYDDSSWWTYDYYIAKISLPMLKKLRDNSHIVHTEFLPKWHSYYVSGKFTEKDENWCRDRWIVDLNRIILAFENYLNLVNGDWEYYHKPEEKNKKWWKEHVKKFNLRVMTKEEKSDMEYGFRLFAKRFSSGMLKD